MTEFDFWITELGQYFYKAANGCLGGGKEVLAAGVSCEVMEGVKGRECLSSHAGNGER